MQEIKGLDRNIQNLLSAGSYSIDYYQREYKWKTKQLTELVNDLSARFLENYSDGDQPKQVAKYGHYFLGSIVVSKQGEKRQIVDGQQRLTTLTLLLIYLNNLQADSTNKVSISSLIYDDDFGEKKFRLSVPERNSCMEALFNDEKFDADGKSESVQNLLERYKDIEEIFPEELKGDVLPLFIYCLKDKVILIEITAYDDADAYTIFETMNDRGLSLSPTDMLKGYLLANIDEPEKRLEANKLTKQRLIEFSEFGKDTESDFFKAWLCARSAEKIRERKKDAKTEDFELIGTEYHRWVRDNKDKLGLINSNDFYNWVVKDFDFYSKHFCRFLKAAQKREVGLESIKYNADHGFTLQLQCLLAPILPSDSSEIAIEKSKVVADFLDCWLNRRLWNSKSNSYSTMQYAVFILCKDIRNLNLPDLRTFLHNRLLAEDSETSFTEPTSLYNYNSKTLHRQLARFTDWLEQKCDKAGKYEDYIIRSGKNAYEIEHIWSQHYEPHEAEFSEQSEFERYRNKVGGLVLLPKKVNASLNDKEYEYKLKHYVKENILAQSLHELCYQNNPGFKQTMEKFGLPFTSYGNFNKKELDERSNLYCLLASVIWSAERLINKEISEAA
jgi:uncharacterized protein with ParB-like and HNH nuclease domain/arsenate reductase-like glutaredoxin family protein